MTTTTTTPPTRLRMPGLGKLISTEFKMYGRDIGNIVFVLAFPTILLVGIGFIFPGMQDPITDAPAPWDGLHPIHLLAPVMIPVAIATAGLSAMPTYLASYREKGVLRRLSTTPMAPQGVLVGQLVVNLAWLVVGSALAIAIGMVVLDVPVPADPLVVALTFPLAVAAIFGIGLIIGGLVGKASTAGGIGMLVYFPMLFFAGLWTPGPAMPEAVANLATWTPLGAAGQAFTAGWFGPDGLTGLDAGMGFPTWQFVSMAVWAVVTFAIAVKTFRWK